MNGRRRFWKTLVGAFVASAVEIRPTTAPVVVLEGTEVNWTTSVLSQRLYDTIYAELLKVSSPKKTPDGAVLTCLLMISN